MSFATFPREVEATYDGTRIWMVMIFFFKCQILALSKSWETSSKMGIAGSMVIPISDWSLYVCSSSHIYYACVIFPCQKRTRGSQTFFRCTMDSMHYSEGHCASFLLLYPYCILHAVALFWYCTWIFSHGVRPWYIFEIDHAFPKWMEARYVKQVDKVCHEYWMIGSF